MRARRRRAVLPFFRGPRNGDRSSAETGLRHQPDIEVPQNAKKGPEGPFFTELDVFEKPKNSEDNL